MLSMLVILLVIIICLLLAILCLLTASTTEPAGFTGWSLDTLRANWGPNVTFVATPLPNVTSNNTAATPHRSYWSTGVSELFGRLRRRTLGGRPLIVAPLLGSG